MREVDVMLCGQARGWSERRGSRGREIGTFLKSHSGGQYMVLLLLRLIICYSCMQQNEINL